jgi:hypothetical protein
MSIRKNTWNLDEHYDLTKSGQNNYVDSAAMLKAELWSFGYNGQGQLGQNDVINRSSPVQMPGTQWSSVSGSYSVSISAIKSDNTLWSWGTGVGGQLGLNDIIKRSSPVQVPGTQWRYAHGGNGSFLATKTDGTLWSWGYNTYGALGQNIPVAAHRSSPVQLPGTNWNLTEISSNRTGSVALKTDGTLWAWGLNDAGQLGLNDVINRSSPIQVPGTYWNSVSHAYKSIHATKTDGTLWSWGKNAYGRFGISDTITRSSPVQVPGTWSSVPISQSYQGWAVKSQELWALGGYNASGKYGLNDVIPRSSPIQVPGTWGSTYTTAEFFSASYDVGVGVKTNGTAWVWGVNPSGNLGLNDLISRSSPVQIPGTQWRSTGVSGYSSGGSVFLLKAT